MPYNLRELLNKYLRWSQSQAKFDGSGSSQIPRLRAAPTLKPCCTVLYSYFTSIFVFLTVIYIYIYIYIYILYIYMLYVVDISKDSGNRFIFGHYNVLHTDILRDFFYNQEWLGISILFTRCSALKSGLVRIRILLRRVRLHKFGYDEDLKLAMAITMDTYTGKSFYFQKDYTEICVMHIGS